MWSTNKHFTNEKSNTRTQTWSIMKKYRNEGMIVSERAIVVLRGRLSLNRLNDSSYCKRLADWLKESSQTAVMQFFYLTELGKCCAHICVCLQETSVETTFCRYSISRGILSSRWDENWFLKLPSKRVTKNTKSFVCVETWRTRLLLFFRAGLGVFSREGSPHKMYVRANWAQKVWYVTFLSYPVAHLFSQVMAKFFSFC